MAYLALAILNSLFFAALALIHLNWLLGGSFGSHLLIPTDGNNRLLYKPNGTKVAVLCAGFLLFILVNLMRTGILVESTVEPISRYGIAAIGMLLLLRAIGDFSYVGFSKRFYNSRFAYTDSWIFSPVCLVMAIFHFALL